MDSGDKPRLSVLVFGAGAIGTYIGGSLALRGEKVVFLERPEVAAELRERGLRLNLNGTELYIPNPNVVAALNEALSEGSFDFAIFGLKSYDTHSVTESLAPYAVNIPPLLCLQNGVDNEPMLEAVLGPSKVIPGTVTSAIGRRAAGDIVVERQRGVGVSAGHPASTLILAALNAAHIWARPYQRPADMKWSKMLTNLLANATSAILDMPPVEIFAHPGLCQLEIAQLREALRVMSTQRIHVVDLPGTPVRALAFAVRALPFSLVRPILQRGAGHGRGKKMPSFHIDLHSGRGQTEVAYLNGAVVRYGEQLGIPIPVNRLLNDVLQGLAAGKLTLDTFSHQPEKLLELIPPPHKTATVG